MPTILVVEDDRDTREMLERFLELEGFTVRAAENGRAALDILGREAACVIVLDLMMPVMNGWEFRRVQAGDARLSQIPVVVVTAAGRREQIPAIDAHAWLPKPLDLDRLLETIQPLCAGV